MDFFLREVDLPQTSLRLTPDVPEERANTVSALLQSILHHGESLPRSWRPGVRGWGSMNETHYSRAGTRA
jgi:hypothetical protein